MTAKKTISSASTIDGSFEDNALRLVMANSHIGGILAGLIEAKGILGQSYQVSSSASTSIGDGDTVEQKTKYLCSKMLQDLGNTNPAAFDPIHYADQGSLSVNIAFLTMTGDHYNRLVDLIEEMARHIVSIKESFIRTPEEHNRYVTFLQHIKEVNGDNIH